MRWKILGDEMKIKSKLFLIGIATSVVAMIIITVVEQLTNQEILLWNLCEIRLLDGVRFLFYLNGTRIILISLFALMFFSILYAVYRKREKGRRIKKLTLFATSAICIIVASFSIFLYIMTEGDDRYFAYSSPDGKYSILAREHSFLLAGGVDVYERTSLITIRRIGVLSTDDGYRALSNSNYQINWNENKVEFTVDVEGYEDTVELELKRR